jgi:tRNA-2-methylthio-N6-dimethylallyladenosine synthase
MKYYVKTFGCQMNESDSRLIALLLEEAGHISASAVEEAEIIVVNTCCVRRSAENRALGFLGALKNYPAKVIAVCGCMPQNPGTAIAELGKMKHINIISGTFALAELPRYIEEFCHTSKRIIDTEEKYHASDIAFSQFKSANFTKCHKAQISVIYGCNNFCSYCVVPYVRGRESSREPELIIAEIRLLAENGCKEVQLLGQNVDSYGGDLNGSWDLARLMEEICHIEGIERIRFMTSHPRDFNGKLLNTIAVNPKICKHFHLPLQSGSNRILELMNRGYSIEEYSEKIHLIREKCPDSAISTDIIAGFPGENEDDFAATLSFMESIKIDSAYTFIYSPRSGTPAAAMSNQISPEEKSKRVEALNKLQSKISLENNEKYSGKTLRVLIDGKSKSNEKLFSGRSEQNKIVVFENKARAKAGDFVNIKIAEAKTWYLRGEMV